MRYALLPILIVCLVNNLYGQTEEGSVEGNVSYVTKQSVYTRFGSTKDISIGDTLFVNRDGKLVPGLVVRQLSSISCVCDTLTSIELSVGDPVFFRKISPPVKPTEGEEPSPEMVAELPAETGDTVQPAQEINPSDRIQRLTGRLSVSTYLNFSNTAADNIQRMRYTFSLDARNMGGTKLSAETYISFVHRLDQWQEIKENVFNGLKIYSLAVKYDFDEKTRILAGRKINPRISSLGAIDGIQFERGVKNFTIGLFVGTRPDYQDYSFNPDLFQFGAYLSHEHRTDRGSMQNTVAFIEQKNNWNPDRRFAYLQHSNTLVKNLCFFGSAEIDLYTLKDSTAQNTFRLTNLYLMLKYQVIKQLSLSLSYNARQNIVYYESDKDNVDRLLEMEALQGFRLQVNYRPVKHLLIGVMGNYRYREEDPKQSKNLYSYVTYSSIPVLKISATVSATFLETSYNSGKIYSAGISRDLVHGKLQAGLNYRYVDYNFYTTDLPFVQNFAEISLNWRILNKLSMSVYYEGTFEEQNTFNRIYINLTQRF